MANIPDPVAAFGGVYQLEANDKALAGPNGIMNRQASDLMARDLFLQSQADALRTDFDSHSLALASPTGSSMVGFIQSGIGAVERELSTKAQETVTPEDFGAVGDGTLHPLSERFATLEEAQVLYPFVTSLSQSLDWAALQSGASTGKRVIGRKKAAYVVDRTISALDADLLVDMNNSYIVDVAGNAPIFSAIGSYGAQVAVSSITKESFDYSAGGTSPTPNPTTVHVLNVASTSGFAVGDVVKIISDDLIEESRDGDLERKGEHAVVGGIATGKLYLYSFLYDNYTTGVRVAKMNKDMVVDIRNVRSSSTVSGNEPLVRLQGLYAPRLDNIVPVRSKSEVLEAVSCVGIRGSDFFASNAKTDFSASSYGYVVVEYSCEFGVYDRLFGHNVRHVYTDGTLIAQVGDVRTERPGRAKGTEVSASTGWFCQNAPFDTHWTSVGIKFNTCVAYCPFNGPESSQRGIQLRGSYGQANNCETYGGTGVSVFQGKDVESSCAENRVNNHTHHFLSNSQSRAAVNVLGHANSVTSNTMPRVVVNGLATFQPSDPVTPADSSSFPHVLATRAIVYANNIALRARQGGSFVACLFQADQSAQIHVNGGFIDNTGSPGTGVRVFKQGPTTKASMRNVRLLGTYSYLTDGQSNNDIQFECEQVSLDSALAVPAGYTNTISTDVRIDYTVGYRKTNRSVFNQSYASGGTKTVSLDRRGAPKLVFTGTVGVSGGNTRIGTIDAGAFDGQELVIRNSSTSLDTLTINSSLLDPAADRVLAAGASATLRYSDATSKWLQV